MELQTELRKDKPHLDILKWAAKHGLVRGPPAKCGHLKAGQDAEHACTSTKFYPLRSPCSARWVCKQPGCGHSVTVRPKGTRGWSLWGELHFVIFFVGGMRRLSNTEEVKRFAKSTELMKLLGQVATIVNAKRVCLGAIKKGWMNLQWDETFHAQRKFQRGRRVRIGGVLTFVGGVTMAMDSDGNLRIAEGVVAGVPNKSRAQQLALLLALAAPGAEVTTDSAAMYRDLKTAAVNHSMVNHSKEFVAASGAHTNAIEGFWSVLKRKLRAWWSHQNADADTCAERFQLAAFFANAGFCGLTPQAAALLLLRLALEIELGGKFNDELAHAKALLCTPTGDIVSEHVEEAVKVEKRFIDQLAEIAKDVAVAPVAAAEDGGAAAADDEHDETLPLNQESSLEHANTPARASDSAAPYLT
mmetsp:Transcript_17599/g.54594  ORF Transcript_17599/g.54594 Transcript_17599/m.54594 type:complete len:415 (+) Transcript_17599:3388-4632(+)